MSYRFSKPRESNRRLAYAVLSVVALAQPLMGCSGAESSDEAGGASTSKKLSAEAKQKLNDALVTEFGTDSARMHIWKKYYCGDDREYNDDKVNPPVGADDAKCADRIVKIFTASYDAYCKSNAAYCKAQFASLGTPAACDEEFNGDVCLPKITDAELTDTSGPYATFAKGNKVVMTKQGTFDKPGDGTKETPSTDPEKEVPVTPTTLPTAQKLSDGSAESRIWKRYFCGDDREPVEGASPPIGVDDGKCADRIAKTLSSPRDPFCGDAPDYCIPQMKLSGELGLASNCSGGKVCLPAVQTPQGANPFAEFEGGKRLEIIPGQGVQIP